MELQLAKSLYRLKRKTVINICVIEGNKAKEDRAFIPHTNNTVHPVEDKQVQLEAIEDYLETLRMRVAEYAKLRIGLDCASSC